MIKHPIHQSADDKLANNSDKTVRAIEGVTEKTNEVVKAVKDLKDSQNKNVETQGFIGVMNNLKANKETVESLKDDINNPQKVVQKLEEVKSAALITNNKLKKIEENTGKDFPVIPPFPTTMEVTMKGLSVVALKGDKGEKGDSIKGDTGEKGEKGDQGERGKTGSPGKPGLKGDKGDKGETGNAGKDGVDGSPDSPDEVVEKVNEAKKKIKAKQVEGLLPALKFIDEYGSNPLGYASGGANQITIQDEGTRVSDHFTTLNFIGAGVSATYLGNGVIAVTVSAGSAINFADNETPSGTIDGSNVTFTLANTPSPAGSLSLYLNGALQQEGVNKDYTLSGSTITFASAPLTSSILLAWYRY